jgi:hypothetical protein
MSDSDRTLYIDSGFKPPLKAGKYRIKIETEFPKIEGHQLPAYFGRSEEWISVGGKRFNFDATDIDSVYPPVNGNGNYAGVLPHIVFYQKGLPWERSVSSGNNAKSPPWLALLLFDQDDPAPAVREMRIGDLPTKTPPGVYFPPFKVEIGEDPNTRCQFFDIPRPLFDQIKPSPEELKYLAHGRKVSMYPKANGRIDPDEMHTFSIVIGNRLPRPGKESVVHLVSFENYGEVLESPLQNDYHSIRLISLRSWRFSTEDKGGSFADHFKDLNNEFIQNEEMRNTTETPIFLQFPFNSKQVKQKETAQLLQRGFLPMEHRFRHRQRGISWYRGPFAPEPTDHTLTPPYRSADSLLLFDPKVGQFDVSYAAAWQLGELLALKNKSFARALYFWKQQQKIKQRKDNERKILENALPVRVDKVTDEQGRSKTFLLPNFKDIQLPGKPAHNADRPAIIPSKNTQHLQDIFVAQFSSGGKKASIRQSQLDPNNQHFRTIRDFIESLHILKPVPYNYLVPHEAYLPPETIRFFFIDPNWINALVDGACSIGDLVKGEEHLRKALLSKEEKKNRPHRQQHFGFLLRSSIVNVWPGVEIRMKQQDGKELIPVRHERLGEDLIISIVPAPIHRIEFRMPEEGLHFGITYSKKEGYYKKIRKQGVQSDQWPKIPVTLNEKLCVPVLDLTEELGKNYATFAFRMIQSSTAISLELNLSYDE